MEYQITVSTVERQLVAAARQRTTFDKIAREIGGLLSPPWALIKESPGLRTDGDNVAIYWDDSGEGSIEVGVQVARDFESTEAVVCSATPAGTVARTAHFGPYNRLRAAHNAVRAWCKQNQRDIVLPFWEIYGDWSDDPSKLRTDVLYLLSDTK
jgi:effector-binding domain-containing protein